jgi:hypothetical protein
VRQKGTTKAKKERLKITFFSCFTNDRPVFSFGHADRWAVNARWLRDSKTFNEIANEEDYEEQGYELEDKPVVKGKKGKDGKDSKDKEKSEKKKSKADAAAAVAAAASMMVDSDDDTMEDEAPKAKKTK